MSEIDTRYDRALDLKDLILLGLSMTIGSGIFVLTDDVAKNSKNLVWLSVFFAGIMSLLTAFSYAELASIFKNNEGEYGYVKAVSNKKVANIMGYVILISDIFILSTISIGMGHYVSKLIGCSPHMIAITVLISLNIINYLGITMTKNVSNVAMYLKLLIIAGIILMSFTNNKPTENLLSTENVGITGFSTASIIALFMYLGFNNITNFAEESHKPATDIPKALVYTVAIVTIIYTLFTIASLFVVSSDELSQTTTPIATITGRLFGSGGFYLLVILTIISLLDTMLVTCVSETRYMHAFISQNHPQYGKSDMDSEHKTPYLSIILLTVLSILIIYVFKDIEKTAICGDLLILTVFIIVNIIVIVLRYKNPDEPREFKIPLNLGKIPITAVIAVILGVYVIYHYVWK